MSILQQKRILVISDDSSFLGELTPLLEEQLAIVSTATYQTYEIAGAPVKSDVIILDHCSPIGVCGRILSSIHTTNQSATVPILAIISQNDPQLIEQVLVDGASDYATRHEPVDLVVAKLKSLLGTPRDLFAPGDIDITEYQNVTVKHGLRVYVVEDDPLLRNLLKHKFEQQNIAAAFSADATNVLTKMLAFKPTVVILDLMLPGSSGFEILEKMQAEPNLKSVPVVVFSNRDSSEDRQRATELGAKKFYVKAVTSLSELVDVLQEVS